MSIDAEIYAVDLDISKQTTFSNAFSWMKSFVFWFDFHWSLFREVQLTIRRHWFRYWLGLEQATSDPVHWRIYAAQGGGVWGCGVWGGCGGWGGGVGGWGGWGGGWGWGGVGGGGVGGGGWGGGGVGFNMLVPDTIHTTNTSRPTQNGRHFAEDIQTHFRLWTLKHFGSYFTEICYHGFH